jgi:electron transport complex protein RnfC
MHNVGTCFAIADAIFSGKPLIERVVTITGEATAKPGNVWALIGSPVAHLLAHCDYTQAAQNQANIIMGGPMMGFNMISDLVPVVKTTNCILAPTDNEMAGNNEQACIRCSACADVCPASLLPQQLFWHSKAKELDKAQEYNLFDCIECGACAYVCPSEIPLVHYYRIAKSEIRVEQEDKQKSDKARGRFEKREARLVAEQQARDEKHRLAAESRKQAMASGGNDAKDKIAAALARAKAKRQVANAVDEKLTTSTDTVSTDTVSTDTVSTEIISTDNTKQTNQVEPAETSTKVASSNQRVQAAIARAKARKSASEMLVTVPESESELKDKKDVLPHQQGSTEADSKQARIAAAVARAKAKREAQKTVSEQGASNVETLVVKPLNEETAEPTASAHKVEHTTTNSLVELTDAAQQTAMKKRKIASVLAKAKAKKLAEKTDKLL